MEIKEITHLMKKSILLVSYILIHQNNLYFACLDKIVVKYFNEYAFACMDSTMHSIFNIQKYPIGGGFKYWAFRTWYR